MNKKILALLLFGVFIVFTGVVLYVSSTVEETTDSVTKNVNEVKSILKNASPEIADAIALVLIKF